MGPSFGRRTQFCHHTEREPPKTAPVRRLSGSNPVECIVASLNRKYLGGRRPERSREGHRRNRSYCEAATFFFKEAFDTFGFLPSEEEV